MLYMLYISAKYVSLILKESPSLGIPYHCNLYPHVCLEYASTESRVNKAELTARQLVGSTLYQPTICNASTVICDPPTFVRP